MAAAKAALQAADEAVQAKVAAAKAVHLADARLPHATAPAFQKVRAESAPNLKKAKVAQRNAASVANVRALIRERAANAPLSQKAPARNALHSLAARAESVQTAQQRTVLQPVVSAMA